MANASEEFQGASALQPLQRQIDHVRHTPLNTAHQPCRVKEQLQRAKNQGRVQKSLGQEVGHHAIQNGAHREGDILSSRLGNSERRPVNIKRKSFVRTQRQWGEKGTHCSVSTATGSPECVVKWISATASSWLIASFPR